MTTETKKRREMMKLLRTSEKIDCLDNRAYLALLSLRIEMTAKNLNAKLATLNKAWLPSIGPERVAG